MRFIIVDDEAAALHLFLDSTYSADSDLEFRFFKDDREAILRYCQDHKVDGAFLDIRMPRIDGVELAKRLIAAHPDIDVVFLTGFNVPESTIEPLRPNVLGVSHKPLNPMEIGQFIDAMRKKKSVLKVRTFGTFDCFLHGQLVRFSSSKSKELFALLIAKNGKSLTMETAITALWPDKDIDKAKILYRDAVWRLRSTLNEIHFPCVGFGRAVLTLNKENISCDYYDLMEGKDVPYPCSFMESYEWSMPVEDVIEQALKGRK